MNKNDFKKGQKVYLFIVEGSNQYRYVKDKPFEARIVPATVTSVGRKYITTAMDKNAWDVHRFEIDNNFFEDVSCGGMDYQLFLSEQDIYDDQEAEALYKEIQQSFKSWKNVGRYSLKQLKTIKEIISEGAAN